MPSEELAEVCTVSFMKISSRSLSAIESLLRMTVATPVRVTTFPTGSSAAAAAGAGAGASGAARGGGGDDGGVCPSRIRPEIAAILACRLIDVRSSSIGEGTADTLASPPSMTQANRESANGSRCDVTIASGPGEDGQRDDGQRSRFQPRPAECRMNARARCGPGGPG